MLRTIIDLYGLWALSTQQLFGSPRQSEREIIDVEYEDLSNQIESNSQLTDKPIPEVQPVLIAMNYADTDNK